MSREGREAGPEGRNGKIWTEGSRGEDGGFFLCRLLANGEMLAKKRFPVQYGKRLETKTAIKRELYEMLSAAYGESACPGGRLTGIRPTKIVL